jgi:beta-glucosidase
MDERALREIYLPAFKAAVQEGGVWAVMGAYNKFRGEHACHNNYLLNKVLKEEWGFKGLVMSDWDGTHDTREAVLNGLDLEMGTEKPYENFYLAGPFREGLQKGVFPVSILDDKVRRNLRQMIAIGALNGRGPGAINTKAHQDAARRIAEEGMVLLKNEGGALPLDDRNIKSVAVIGENAVQLQAYGGGSARIKAFYEVAPLEGIVRRAGQRVNVTYSTGYRAEPDPDLVGRAVRAASQADVAIIVGGLNHSKYFDAEASDRKDMRLPYGQDELIQRVVEANPRTIVVFLGGGPMEMGPWLSKVPAVMVAWYPGMEGGNALARVLFGDVNPSGKLPCTFPKRLEDSPAHALKAYPGKDGQVMYSEGILVGYRWFDTKKIEPLFPFGYGLSYTNFKYSALNLTEGRDSKGPVAIAEFEIENTGTREGGEVAQLYVNQAQPGLPRPVKELKGFQKVFLRPGEKQKVSIPLERSAFAYYDPNQKGWLAEKGEFTILIGSSSRDIRLESKFALSQTSLEK